MTVDADPASHRAGPPHPERTGRVWSTGTCVRLAVVVGVVVGMVVLHRAVGFPDVQALHDRIAASGRTGGLVFVVGFALLALLPVPKGALTALGGLLFGLWLGAALSFVGAVLGALLAREAGAWLGRGTVDRLTRGRSARAEHLLRDHGVGAVVSARLIPVLPYVVINYACGLLAVPRRDYLVGSMVGLVPGSLIYAAVGASGGHESGRIVVLPAMLVLLVVTGTWGRRRLRAAGLRDPTLASGGAPPAEPASRTGTEVG